MNKEEYIQNLYDYTKKKGIRIYDYYKQLATLCRKYKKFNIIGFEAHNPFLTPEDYRLLLESSDELMPEFFARAMVKVIGLNDILIANSKKSELNYDTIKGIIDEEYRKIDEAEQVANEEKIEAANHSDQEEKVEQSTETEQTEKSEQAEQADEVATTETEKQEKPCTALMVVKPKITSLVPVMKKQAEPRKAILPRVDIEKIIKQGLYNLGKKTTEIPQDIINQFIKNKEEKSAALVPAPIVEETQKVEEEPKEEPKKKASKKGIMKSSVLDRIVNNNGAKGKVATVLEKLTQGSEKKVEETATTEAEEIPAPKTEETTEQKAEVTNTQQVKALPAHKEECTALVPIYTLLGRDEILAAINKAMENVTVEEAKEEVQEEPKKKGFSLTSINFGIIEKLKGLALIRESKTGKANIYYHNPITKTLKGRKNADDIKADSGYYVNYQEYIYKMINHTMKKYPEAAGILFVDENGEERPLETVVEEIFKTLRLAGAIRFGNEYSQAVINSYADLEKMTPGYGIYANEKLKKGIYVRRDILVSEFKKYKLRLTLKQEEDESTTTYKKTK